MKYSLSRVIGAGGMFCEAGKKTLIKVFNCPFEAFFAAMELAGSKEINFFDTFPPSANIYSEKECCLYVVEKFMFKVIDKK